MTQGSAIINGGRIELSFDYDMTIIDKVRQIDGRKWNEPKHPGVWTVPVTAWHADMVMKMLPDFYIDPTISFMAEGEKEKPKLKLPKELYKFQKEGVQYIASTAGRCIVADDMGLGKAQSLSASILTRTGWTTMGSVAVGDYILGKDREVKIKQIHPRGVMDVYQVTFSDGSKTECTLDHLWEVNTPTRKLRKAKPLVLSLRQILQRGLKDAWGNRKFFIPMMHSGDYMYPSPDWEYPLDPYVLGTLLGDGGLTGDVPVLTSVDVELLEFVSDHLPSGVSLKWDGKCGYRISKVDGNQFDTNPLTKILRDLKVMGESSLTKKIPELYLYGNPFARLEILRGLMDTDGWVELGKRGNHTAYCSASKQLALDVQFIVRSLGGVATIHWKDNDHAGAWVVSISLPSGVQPFRLKRKAELHNLYRVKYEPTRSMESIKYVGKKEVQCITVDAEDGLYITDNLIVTHNSLEALMFVRFYTGGKTLIVSPSNVTFKWRDEECRKWVPDKTVEVVRSSKDELPDVDILIMSYAMMVAHYNELRNIPFTTAIIDEAHAIKGQKTQRTRIAKALLKDFKHVLLLSGTPFMNRPTELFQLLNVVDPIGFNNFYSYAIKYCGAERIGGYWVFPKDKVTNREELEERLKRYMIRRTKQEVELELPDLSRVYVPVELSSTGEYNKALAEFKDWRKQAKSMASALVKLTKLRQIVGMEKVEPTVELATSIVEAGRKVVIFAHHKEVVMALAKALVKVGEIGIISGDTKPEERQALAQKFLLDNSKICIMIITVAGAEGINLFSASDIIFCEREWTPAKEEQAEARLHRIGQKSSVTSYYIVVKDSVDEYMNTTVKNKRDVIGQVISQDEIVESILKEI